METHDGKTVLATHFSRCMQFLNHFIKSWKRNKITRINTPRGLGFALACNGGMTNVMVQVVKTNRELVCQIQQIFEPVMIIMKKYYFTRVNHIDEFISNSVIDIFDLGEDDKLIDFVKQFEFQIGVQAYSNVGHFETFVIDVGSKTVTPDEVVENEIRFNLNGFTDDTAKQTTVLMDYLYTYPQATLQYYAGDMQLHIKSDAAYLVLPGARSRVAGYFYLRAHHHPNKTYPGRFNAPVLIAWSTLKNVVSSAARSEYGGLFHNCTTAIGLCNALNGMGHQQQQTPVITDNSTAYSFVHSKMRVKRSKSWDMRFNWLRDRAAQQQFFSKLQAFTILQQILSTYVCISEM